VGVPGLKSETWDTHLFFARSIFVFFGGPLRFLGAREFKAAGCDYVLAMVCSKPEQEAFPNSGDPFSASSDPVDIPLTNV
jgi:hypothetical protein